MSARQFGLDYLNEQPRSPEQDATHALWVELDLIVRELTQQRDRLPFHLPANVDIASLIRQYRAARRVTSWAYRVTDRVKAVQTGKRKGKT